MTCSMQHLPGCFAGLRDHYARLSSPPPVFSLLSSPLLHLTFLSRAFFLGSGSLVLGSGAFERSSESESERREI